jgi:hypothetical protein
MSSRHIRATGKGAGVAWSKVPVNLPPMETNGMPRRVRKRAGGDERTEIQEWAKAQPWFPTVWMGRTYCSQHYWIWILKTSP